MPRRLWFPFLAFPLLFLALLGLGAAVFVGRLGPEERAVLGAAAAEHRAVLLGVALVLLGGLGGGLWWLMTAYLRPLRRLGEETRLVFGANAAHRVAEAGAPGVRALAASVNAVAARFEARQEGLEDEIRAAQAAVERERNTLAAVMAGLREGVLVCTDAGQILLYNAAARDLLAAGDDGGYVGVGRSVYDLLDPPLLVHALDELQHRRAAGRAETPVRFLAACGPRLLRARLAGLPAGLHAGDPARAGFLLLLHDATDDVAGLHARDRLVQTLAETARGRLGAIRAAAENLQAFPDLDPARRTAFEQLVLDEAAALGRELADAADTLRRTTPAERLGDTIAGTDLLHAVVRHAEARLDLRLDVQRDVEAPVWLVVDAFALVQALLAVLRRTADATGTRRFALRTHRTTQGATDGPAFVGVDLTWDGPAVAPGTVRAWENDAVVVDGAPRPYTLADVLHRHGAALWADAPAEGPAALHLLLPLAEPPAAAVATAPGPGPRPVFYDFDLFDQPAPPRELDERPLAQLAYTVFDTETTGLQPSEGDRIIQVGAVRVVNGKLREDEVFDQLVDPQRPLSLASIRVHGIEPVRLHGQPPIEAVLPRFHRFAEGTVLVAHNAAFDLRFLQLSEAAAGVRFDHPVLDTLLLSAALHPSHDDHGLDALAARFGVPVTGRHTALGDALVTARLLLKLLPLLAEQGIHTLADARRAARATPFARLEY